MSRKLASFDATDLHTYAKQLKMSAKQWDAFMVQQTGQLAQRLEAKVKMHTPVGSYPAASKRKGGELRRAWRIQKVGKVGDAYIVTMANSKNYAIYVNNGHRTRPATNSSAKGKEPKVQRWVEGQFFVEAALSELEPEIESQLETAMYDFLSSRGLM